MRCTANNDYSRVFWIVVGAAAPAREGRKPHGNEAACQGCSDNRQKLFILPRPQSKLMCPTRFVGFFYFQDQPQSSVIGANAQLSKLKFGPESPTYDYSGFYVGPKPVLLFKDCIIEGPTYAGPTENGIGLLTRYCKQDRAVQATTPPERCVFITLI